MIIRSQLLRNGRRPLVFRLSKSPLLSRQLAYPAAAQARSHWSDSLPTIIRPSFWSDLYPGLAKWITQRKERRELPKVGKKKGWNPATFYIWMAMLIGSQSINLILLRNEWQVFSRKADAKIAHLKEVIQRVQDGEDVDVEKELGTGDEVAEREWQDVVREMEHEDRLWEKRTRRRKKILAKQKQQEDDERQAKNGPKSAEEPERSPPEDDPTKT